MKIMKYFYRIILFAILLNFYSSYSYAQSCLKDFGLKGPVRFCHIDLYDVQESPDGYEYILNNSSIFNLPTFPFDMWTAADETVGFDESGRVKYINLYDAPFRYNGSVIESRIIYEYRNDRLHKVTLFHSPDRGIDLLWIKYDEQGEMTDLYRRVTNQIINHYKYTKIVNGDISISLVNNNSMSEIAKIHDNQFLLKVGQKYVNLPYLLNPLSISVLNDMYNLSNIIIKGAEDWYIATTADTLDPKIKEIYKITFDRETERFDDAVLFGKIEVNEDNDIVKLNNNNGSIYYFKYEDYDEYGNWTSCTRYFAETGIEDILIKRSLSYY